MHRAEGGRAGSHVAAVHAREGLIAVTELPTTTCAAPSLRITLVLIAIVMIVGVAAQWSNALVERRRHDAPAQCAGPGVADVLQPTR